MSTPSPRRKDAFCLLSALTVWALTGCDPLHTEFGKDETPLYYTASNVVLPDGQPSELLIMDWNIKFGGGRIDFFFDCYGDRVLMTGDEVEANLQGLAAKINSVDPDILLLQEVDIDSKRSGFIDQVQWLLDHTRLNFGVYASQWRADFIPSDGLGAMDSGNAVLSRWPLKDANRIALALRSDQDSLTRYFYLRRNILTARVEVPGQRDFHIVNMHAEAYGADGTKKKHIDRFNAELDALNAQGALFVGGGDFNTIPPGSIKVKDFDDSVCTNEDFVADDFSEEKTWLLSLYAGYSSAIDLQDYQQDNTAYFSHTVNKDGFWNRTLDYLFTNGEWRSGSGLVHQDADSGGMETMPLSDHAPLTAVLVLP